MRSIEFHPSSSPPVCNRDLEQYADKWVVVRGGRVVLHADSYDALVALRPTSRRFKNRNDRIVHLPPRSISTEEDVPVVVDLRDGGPGCDGYTVVAIAASGVGVGAFS